ncbi:dihydrofolate reductase family protein, partial [Euzebya sp.]|uniref:dihydrofolate reductase family protein n=1 Tax=Euzebya sp. TaxID=1971409 RepID=UPI0035168156
MTRTRYYTATTLDGFLADPHDSLDWLFVQDHDPDGPLGHAAFMADVGALVMGATTYDWIRAHMDQTGEGWAYDVPTWVLTHRDLPPVEGADIRFAAADDEAGLAAVHADLVAAADGRDIWVVGGGGLAADLAAAGLLDEIAVSIAAVTLGAGKPLLPRPIDLRLTSVDRNRAFVCATYEVVG